jgi:hypothetical protein
MDDSDDIILAGFDRMITSESVNQEQMERRGKEELSDVNGVVNSIAAPTTLVVLHGRPRFCHLIIKCI